MTLVFFHGEKIVCLPSITVLEISVWVRMASRVTIQPEISSKDVMRRGPLIGMT